VTRWVQRCRLALGILSLGVWTIAALDAAWFSLVQGRTLDRLLSDPAGSPSVAGSGARATASQLALLGRIQIPRVGLSAIIAEGRDPKTLRRAVGHLPGTSFPGEPGNVVLAGHRDSHFRGLRHVRRGDRVRIMTPDGEFDYRIASTDVVAPDNTEVLRATEERTLTLVTFFPFDVFGPAPRRFIVLATQEEQSAGGD